MNESIEIVIDIPKTLWLSENGSHRSHWYVSTRRKDLKWLGFTKMREYLAEHEGVCLERAHVTAFVQYPSNNRADPMNAAPTVKPIIDGFTQSGIWVDDDSKHVTGPDFRREKGTTGVKGLHRIRFLIEKVNDAEA